MTSNHLEISQQQQEFIAMIFELNGDQGAERSPFNNGLRIYQNNLLMTAARALSISYPVLEKLLGQEAMISLSRELLGYQPPQTGDWADWGGELDKLVEATALINDHPYLSDLVRLEWLMHQASRAMTPITQVDTLSKLSTVPLESIYLRLSDSVRLFHSHHPIAELWHAHQSNGEPFVLNKQALAQSLHEFSGESHLLVHQSHDIARLKKIPESEFRWLTDISLGYSLSELLDRHPDFDFIEWLSMSVQERLLDRLD